MAVYRTLCIKVLLPCLHGWGSGNAEVDVNFSYKRLKKMFSNQKKYVYLQLEMKRGWISLKIENEVNI